MRPTDDYIKHELRRRGVTPIDPVILTQRPRRDHYRWSNNKPRIWEGVRRKPLKLLVWIALGATCWFTLAVGFAWVKHLAGRIF